MQPWTARNAVPQKATSPYYVIFVSDIFHGSVAGLGRHKEMLFRSGHSMALIIPPAPASCTRHTVSLAETQAVRLYMTYVAMVTKTQQSLIQYLSPPPWVHFEDWFLLFYADMKVFFFNY